MRITAGPITDFATAAILLDSANDPREVFGPLPADGDLSGAVRAYRRLARLVHPDLAPDRRRAELLFIRLGLLHEQYMQLADTGGRLVVPTKRGSRRRGTRSCPDELHLSVRVVGFLARSLDGGGEVAFDAARLL
jgi:hypothetical protein